MNTEESKTKAKVVKRKKPLKNGGQQVFVLPPNLLHKLGINLGAVGSTNNAPNLEQNIKVTSIPNKPKKIQNKTPERNLSTIPRNETKNNDAIDKNTTIMKTASLMRESLFMSPSFTNLTSNEVPNFPKVDERLPNPQTNNAIEGCQIEESSNKKSIPNVTSLENNIVNEDYCKDIKLDEKLGDGGLSIDNGTFKLQNAENELVFEECKPDITDNDSAKRYMPTILPLADSDLFFKESPFNQTKLSSTVNLEGLVNKNDNLKINDDGVSTSDSIVTVAKESKKTINIISEEILTISEKKELNFLQNTPKSSLISASLNTIIVKNSINNPASQSKNSSDSVLDIHGKDCVKSLDLEMNKSEDSNKNSECNEKIISQKNKHLMASSSKKSTENKQKELNLGQTCKNELSSFNDISNRDINHLENINHKEQGTFLSDNVNKVKQVRYNEDKACKNNMENSACSLSDSTNINNNNLQLKGTERNSEEYIQEIMSDDQMKNITNNDIDIKDFEKKVCIQSVDEQLECNVLNIEITEGVCLKRNTKYVSCDDVNTEQILPLNAERINIISKSCIQGVEKPGGAKIMELNTVLLKTYSRIKKSKGSGNETCSNDNSIGDATMSLKLTNNIDVKEHDSEKFSDIQHFCICSDFGSLPLYDCNDNREHIHFLENKPLNCNSDVIFSIYNNSDITDSERDPGTLDLMQDKNDDLDSFSICWSYANAVPSELDTEDIKIPNMVPSQYFESCSTKQEDITSKSINNENSKMDMDITTCESVMRHEPRKRKISNKIEVTINKKQKRSDNFSDCIVEPREVTEEDPEEQCGQHLKDMSYNTAIEDNENRKPLDNKCVRCAVCNVDVATTAWLRHIASTHDYLAWQVGETPVDLEDDDSIKEHLQHIVQQFGKLVCCRCGLTRKYVKPFLHHIQQCNTSLTLGRDRTTLVVKCGACRRKVEEDQWVEHIAKEHAYLAVKAHEKLLDLKNDRQIRCHLNKILDLLYVLKCAKCGAEFKNANIFVAHVKNCEWNIYTENATLDATEVNESDIIAKDEDQLPPRLVTCGVCKEEVLSDKWLSHIQREHNYLAWQDGDSPLDFEDDKSIQNHLYSVIQEYGPLECSKCGRARKYVKTYLQHIEICTGPKEPSVPKESFEELESILDQSCASDAGVDGKVVKCGVCHLELDAGCWIDHIQKNHNYLSWQEGHKPINLCDEDIVRRYLYIIAQKLGALVCAKCGVARKYVKSYLSHIESCSGPDASLTSGKDNFEDVPPIVVNCGVCKQGMDLSQWIDHIQVEHEYRAWQEGQVPLNLDDQNTLRQHLHEVLQEAGKLVCSKCGKTVTRVQLYLQHVESCASAGSTLPVKAYAESNYAEVKCGVCHEVVKNSDWLEHICLNHEYVAWIDTEEPVDLDDTESIKQHLLKIIKTVGALKCPECGVQRKYPKTYLTHVNSCCGKTYMISDRANLVSESRDLSASLDTSVVDEDDGDGSRAVKCGVCGKSVKATAWIAHIQKQHNYLAWQATETPLNLEDEKSVINHLDKIARKAGRLTCAKCGQLRRKVSEFYEHTKTCEAFKDSKDLSTENITTVNPKEQIELNGTMVKCAVCQGEVQDSAWIQHIAAKHDYMAWKEGDKPLNESDEVEVRNHLYDIVQQIGELVCKHCGITRKYAKSYMQHVKTCLVNPSDKGDIKFASKVKKEIGDIVTCALCRAEMDDTVWVEHIAAEHRYLAWRDRDPPIDLENELEVRNHLKRIIQKEGYLKCSKCGQHRKYPKVYLDHVKTCSDAVDEVNDSLNESGIPDDEDCERNEADEEETGPVKCGVCAQEMNGRHWVKHIQTQHKYLAWKDGEEEPFDVNDNEAVFAHLQKARKKYSGLVCGGCGLSRRKVTTYLQHVQTCLGQLSLFSNEIVVCGVCGEQMEGSTWRSHAMDVHYNVTWLAGSIALDRRNWNVVERCLKEYVDTNRKLECKVCKTSRASLAGFYAHVLVCGKSDEEVDSWKDVCDICNQKYLCIYKNQHYQTHKAQEQARERKLQAAAAAAALAEPDVALTPGRRRAAEKARSVIGDYASTISLDTTFKCAACGFGSDSQEELSQHKCSPRDYDECDTDYSISLDDYSEGESDDSEIDSDVSMEENAAIAHRKHKSKSDSSANNSLVKCQKLPYSVANVQSYIEESKNDFFKILYTREKLYKHWIDFSFEVLPDELKDLYMPALEESCKLKNTQNDWKTYKRFEARKEKGFTVMFTGASIHCLAWAPVHPDNSAECSSLLAVACHRGPDCPRLLPTDTVGHPSLIQLWDFGNFRTIPKFAFGLAHDYGTVWAIDWCPSGARDLIGSGASLEDNTQPRLGLLAIACSNGSAYILPVPYPNQDPEDVTFYKVKPCVELKIRRGKRKYQATSINWSLVEGFTTIMVGYGDGTIASYDLVTDSPLLTSKNGDMIVLYPYQDERVHNSSVTGLTSCLEGAWCSSSVTGATGGVGAVGEPRGGGWAVRPARAQMPLATSAALFSPHWPSVLLSGDDTIGLSVSELEWGGSGRRVGCVRAFAACAHRGRVAAAVPPLLQLMRPHPAFTMGQKGVHRKTVGMIEMSPLTNKRSKKSNDKLAMIVEPIKYEDAILSYGIELTLEKDLDKAYVQKMQSRGRPPFPERFPLADVPAMAWCPAAAHHARLALATHAGLLLLLHM